MVNARHLCTVATMCLLTLIFGCDEPNSNRPSQTARAVEPAPQSTPVASTTDPEAEITSGAEEAAMAADAAEEHAARLRDVIEKIEGLVRTSVKIQKELLDAGYLNPEEFEYLTSLPEEVPRD